jgi:hypothetical protein
MHDREQAHRAELQKIQAAGQAAEAELKALDVAIDKADDALEAHPLMIATRRAIADHHLSDADARALIRAQRTAITMAQVGQRMAEARDERARVARSRQRSR